MGWGRPISLDARDTLDEAVDAVRGYRLPEPTVGLVLGTGLGPVARQIEIDAAIPFGEIPHFSRSSVDAREGHLILGTLGGTPVAAMEGRPCPDEGFQPHQVAFPVRVLKLLGVGTLVVSAPCKCMNPEWAAGDVVLLKDHINLLGDNPLVGPNLDDLGPRFPDMSQPYDEELRLWARQVASEAGIALHQGVFLAVQGPDPRSHVVYGKPSDLGADVVGSSLVPEVIVGRHMGMRILALTTITDASMAGALEPQELEANIERVGKADLSLATLIRGVVTRLSKP